MPRAFLRIPAQVAQVLRAEIAAGAFALELPGEKVLAAQYQVSRKTVRAALAILRSDGVIATRNGVGSRIVAAIPAARPAARSVRIGLLMPEAVEFARQHTLLWINHLMELLQRAGYQFEVFHGRKYFGATSSRSLQKLTRSKPVACWILARSNQHIQNWFQRSGLPVVVAGSTHRGIALPSVDVDHRALCRHAATLLLRHGHRRIALFFEQAGHAGDLESETGFVEAFASLPGGEAQASICKTERTPGSVVRELRRLTSAPKPPTAFLLSNSFSYLTVSSYLTSAGQRIPADVSLISRDEEPFLQHLHPLPSRYCCPPQKFASALFHAIGEAVREQRRFVAETRIMPDFLPGNSVGARPRPQKLRVEERV
jgi:DNA-binding LacI/PurR family transcriptional regulator